VSTNTKASKQAINAQLCVSIAGMEFLVDAIVLDKDAMLRKYGAARIENELTLLNTVLSEMKDQHKIAIAQAMLEKNGHAIN
jgi:hypothetical protein